jgi:hypothetical protein
MEEHCVQFDDTRESRRKFVARRRRKSFSHGGHEEKCRNSVRGKSGLSLKKPTETRRKCPVGTKYTFG